MKLVDSPDVQRLIKQYPPKAQERLNELRDLIIGTARENEDIEILTETLKWGEPSYLTKVGSTIRIDWKERTPDKYFIYFICTTELVNTFRTIFGEELQYEGQRAIVLDLNEKLPVTPLKRCIALALTYKKIRHLPMLGC